MTNVEIVLIVLLSVGFIILLTVSIILVSLMIAVMKNVKRISERAEEATSNVAGIAEIISTKLAPIATSGIVTFIARMVTNKKRKGK